MAERRPLMFVPAPLTRLGRAQRQVSTSFSLPAPTGGINARDAYTDMKPDDAVAMVNVFPEANYVAVRKGHASWSTGMTNAVQTLLVYNGSSGSDKLFAAAGSKIWDATSSGAASSVVTGLSNAKWQWTNIENSGGLYLIAVNGADSARSYDGTTWATPAITGATSSTFINVCQFKKRLWFVKANSLDLYYLATEAIAGPASLFSLGSVFRRGGYIMAIGSFSRDAGEGPDDFLTVVTNNGEVAVYQGTDPDSATTFSLVGMFDVGKPIGRRCMARLNGDLTIITQDGVISMQAALQFDRSAGQKAAVTAKIQTLFSQLASSYRLNFGWQPCVYPKSRYLIVNVPAASDSSQSQLVMNTVTGSWTQFTGMNAGCWAVANDLLYFGGNAGTVYQADNGYLDNSGSIQFSCRTAWQMHAGATNKQFTAVQPVMLTGGSASFAIQVDVDFQTVAPTGYIDSPAVAGMTWPFTWPGTWGGTNVLDARWQSVGAIGTWASINIAGSVNGSGLQMNSFNLVSQRGGIY